MEEWKEYKLCEVANLFTGFPFDGHKYAKEGQRVVRGDNVTIGALRWDTDKDKRWNESFERAKEYSLQEEDIVIGMDGSRVGRNRAQIKAEDLPLYLAQRVACIRHNEKALQKFLYYVIFSKSFENYIKSVYTGTSIPHISLKQIGDFNLRVPNLSKQYCIAKILGVLDNKIELNRRINENLEQQAQALFKSWFIDNKNNKLQYYELGNITLITAGGDKPSVYSKDLTEQCRIPIYSNGTENEGLYGYTTSAKINSASITISARGTIGYVCLRTEPYVPIVRLISVVPNIENLSAEYLYLWALTQNINGTGTTQQQLTVPNFRHTLIGIPTKEKMIRFNNIVSPIFQRIVINKNENRILSQLRDTLLPRLMSGELEIKDNSYD